MGGPCAADATRHVLDVGDYETMGVSFLTRDADGVAAGARGLQSCGVVDAHDGRLTERAGDKVVCCSGSLIEVAVCGQS